MGGDGGTSERRGPEGRRSRRIDRHGGPGHRRHAGPAAGQALRRALLPQRRPRPRHRRLQLPARGRHRDEHRRRLRDLVLGARLRRLRHGARPDHPAHGCRGSRARSLLLADVQWLDGAPVVESPRQILKRQLERLDERGWGCFVGTELEFMLFDDSFEQAFDKRYTDLRPSNQYNLDYSILAPAGSSRCCARSGSACATPGCRSSRPRASATSASTRSRSNTPTRSRPATTT